MLGCLPLSCNFEDRGQVPGIAVGFTDSVGDFPLDEESASRPLVNECAMLEESRFGLSRWRGGLKLCGVTGEVRED